MRVSLLSCVRLFATPWTIDHQAPLFIEFFRQEYWRGLPFLTPGDLPNPGIKPVSCTSCIGRWIFFKHCTTWETDLIVTMGNNYTCLSSSVSHRCAIKGLISSVVISRMDLVRMHFQICLCGYWLDTAAPLLRKLSWGRSQHGSWLSAQCQQARNKEGCPILDL